MSSRFSTASPAQHLIFRTDAKPLRLTGVLLAEHTILDEENGESDTRVRLFRTEKGALGLLKIDGTTDPSLFKGL